MVNADHQRRLRRGSSPHEEIKQGFDGRESGLRSIPQTDEHPSKISSMRRRTSQPGGAGS
jgi:hypothetical protein